MKCSSQGNVPIKAPLPQQSFAVLATDAHCVRSIVNSSLVTHCSACCCYIVVFFSAVDFRRIKLNIQLQMRYAYTYQHAKVRLSCRRRLQVNLYFYAPPCEILCLSLFQLFWKISKNATL